MAKKRKKFEMPKSTTSVVDGVTITRYGDEHIYLANTAEAAEEYQKLYGANKNLYRAIPSMIDGLKPVMRRLLWSWWISDGKPQNTKPETLRRIPMHKVETIRGNVMNFHPHSVGDVDDIIGRLGQDWKTNVTMIRKQGAYGNQESSGPASGRYISAGLSEFIIDCFFDNFNKYCIPMRNTYNGKDVEPEYLPAKYPYVLVNPQFSSVGYGLSSNIPSFNFKEVLEATIKLIKDPKTKIMLIPDIPTGCDIVDTGTFKKMNYVGDECPLMMQAHAEIDYENNIITITALPFNGMTKNIRDKILAFKRTGKLFTDVIDFNDNTKEEVHLEILLKKGANPEKILNQLYKKDTGLRDSLPVTITVIDDFATKQYGIKDLILDWIDYRRDAVRAMLLNDLQLTIEDDHMNDVLILVSNDENRDDTVRIASKSANKKEQMEKYMKRYNISSLQAQVVADMRTSGFTKEACERYKETKKKLKLRISEIERYLESSKSIDEYIIKELEEGIKKYGKPRRCKVVKVKDDALDEIPSYECLVGISSNGYIKKIKMEKDTGNIGVVGDKFSNIMVMKINNTEDILVVDEYGRLVRISVSAIPDSKFEDSGIDIHNLFDVKGNVKACLELPSVKLLKDKNKEYYIIFITENGYAKKVGLSEFKRLSGATIGINLDKDDKLATALFVKEDSKDDIIICTNKGNGIRISHKDIKVYGKAARGLLTIMLMNGEKVSNASLINPKKEYLLYITSSGKMKLTNMDLFPRMERRDEVLTLIKLTNTESLLGVASVDKNDKLIIYKQTSEPVTIDVNAIPVKARMSSGEKVTKIDTKDSVVSFKVFTNK